MQFPTRPGAEVDRLFLEQRAVASAQQPRPAARNKEAGTIVQIVCARTQTNSFKKKNLKKEEKQRVNLAEQCYSSTRPTSPKKKPQRSAKSTTSHPPGDSNFFLQREHHFFFTRRHLFFIHTRHHTALSLKPCAQLGSQRRTLKGKEKKKTQSRGVYECPLCIFLVLSNYCLAALSHTT